METLKNIEYQINYIAKKLLFHNLKISTAESCTSGKIGAKLTSLSGSSTYYEGGVLSYSNEAKNLLLGIPLEDIVRYKVVSEEIAKQMAKAIALKLNCDIGLSTTGVLGPNSDDDHTSIGQVCFAIYSKKMAKSFCCTKRFLGQTRKENLKLAVDFSFQNLIKFLDQNYKEKESL